MKKFFIISCITMFCAPLAYATSLDYSGHYTCENDAVVGSIDLDDSGSISVMDIRIERKETGVVNQFSGAATKSTLGKQNLTVFDINANNKLWFNADGSVQYNHVIDCAKQ